MVRRSQAGAGRRAPQHPGRVQCLAGAYLVAGRHTEAVALYERTLADRERVLGAEHPNTLGARHSLAAARRLLHGMSSAGGQLQD
jgi:Tetratricopeptide repeat